MKRITLLVAAVLTLPAAVEAQASAAAIAKALAPLPARAAQSATVIRWNADFTYDVLQEGTSQMVCYDRSDEARRAAFDVQCTNLGNLERVAQNRRFRASSADRAEENAMIEAAEADGTRIDPVYGSMWMAMRGDNRGSAGIHTTIAVPWATGESTGFPETREGGGAYIMAGGTSGAHLMVPGR